MKKTLISLLVLGTLTAHAQSSTLELIQEKQEFTATSKNLKKRFGAKILCNEKNIKIACYAFHFKPLEEIANPNLAAIAGYGSETDEILGSITASAECKEIRGLPQNQVILKQNGEDYVDFRAGVNERAKVLHLTQGTSYISSLNCDLTKLYEAWTNKQ